MSLFLAVVGVLIFGIALSALAASYTSHMERWRSEFDTLIFRAIMVSHMAVAGVMIIVAVVIQ